ncbi:MAG TPA: protein translocase subunit SecF [Coriobacteriia bacterium]|nr:protein translocase subunit SecF [Coriobacteriia bacterium]
MRKFQIDFLGMRNIMFGVSVVLLIVSIGALAVRGLQFGVEFKGGTVINVVNSGSVTEAQLEDALKQAGVVEPSIQSTAGQGTKGYIVRTSVTDPDQANSEAIDVAKKLGLPSNAFQVTTIGPGWGANVTNRAMMALALSIAAILLYISLRFEYKMSITAVIALVHDVLITLGIYALVGREVTPNTISALLTILGYSLYDTVVVFHRIKENAEGLQKQSFMSMANESLNEVIVRTMNTSITSLIPVLAMLFFGGETLRDFALALAIGMLVGAYSSIGVATPIYVLWKETEPKFAALKKKYANA